MLPYSTASHHTDTLKRNGEKHIPNFKTTCHYFMCRYGQHHVNTCEIIWRAHLFSRLLPPAILLLHSATQSSAWPAGHIAIWALFTQTLTVTLQPSCSMTQQQTRHPLAPKKLLKTDRQQWHAVLLGNYLFQQIVTLLKECYVVWEEFISCVKGNRCRREQDIRTLRGCCDWSRALFWTALVFYFSNNVESLL